jgi:hypothetical protein
MTHEEYLAKWGPEAVAAKARAYRESKRVKLEAKPTAEQRAEKAWKPSLEVMAKANQQSNQMLVERTEAEMEEAQLRRQREEFVRHAQFANERAVELGYFQRRMEALAERRWDPTGNWGPQRYTDE